MTSRGLCRVSSLLAEAAGTRPVLGLDTGTPVASLALVVDGRIAGQVSHPTSSHGASLPGAARELMTAAGVRPGDLGAVSVAVGPGSFTGLRVGLSYAKGLATAGGCAIVGVPSLDAAAITALDSPETARAALVCPVVDARKGEVYTALYRVVADGLDKMTDALVLALERLASRIQGSVVLLGDSKAKDAAVLISSRGLGVAVLDSCWFDSRGAAVAAIGAAGLARGQVDRLVALEPLYLRPAEVLTPHAAPSAAIGMEGLWSDERKNSFGSI